MNSGTSGPARNVIPTTASAVLDLRLVREMTIADKLSYFRNIFATGFLCHRSRSNRRRTETNPLIVRVSFEREATTPSVPEWHLPISVARSARAINFHTADSQTATRRRQPAAVIITDHLRTVTITVPIATTTTTSTLGTRIFVYKTLGWDRDYGSGHDHEAEVLMSPRQRRWWVRFKLQLAL